ncbi:divisome protein SepX/GlpR [Corynebacterium bouchesdurhonense]|uniref:divisome protein SepX/GlpR n=1 Tax=Corynebacterium bouchesdurhonense TaxID=1720192 RepID=UPI00082B7E44|nr:gephyrin-like molybdotransferase receptor GlpR [Corynebacterium bouchesdurhonense]
MGPSLIILLIIVVWVIVLAPLVLGDNKPIRRSGEGYEETRVLHEGGSTPVAARRRPKLTAADVHRYGPEEGEYEVVEAVSDEERVLIDDTKSGLKPLFAKRTASAEVVAAEPAVIDAEAEPADAAAQDDAPAEGETPASGGSTAVSVLQARAAAEDMEDTDDAGATEDTEDAGDTADTEDTAGTEDTEAYLDPSDFGYAEAELADSVDVDEDAEVDADDADDAANSADEEETLEAGDADTEPTDEDIAFAQTRRGRGGWDPQQDERNRASRYQRRQRTFAGLLIACVITLVAAAMFGGWVWVLPAISIGLTAWFLVALRQLVKKERALRQRRMRQLRRARLGVDTGHTEHAASATGRRRAGAIVVDMDDESPDFDHLPRYRQPEPEYSSRRPERIPEFDRAS